MKPKMFFKSKAVQIVFAAIVGLIVGFFGGLVLERSFLQPPETVDVVYTQEPAQVQEGFQAIQNIQAAFRDVSSQVLPSVVEIDVVNVVQAQLPNIASPFDFFFGPGLARRSPHRSPPRRAEPGWTHLEKPPEYCV